jgi:hypothetical protein
MDRELTIAEALQRIREQHAERPTEKPKTPPPPLPEHIERAIRE